MKHLLVLTVVVGAAVAGCGKGGGGGGPGKDWSGKPLDVTIESKVKGAGFRIQAPAGMKLDGDDAPDAITKSWKADVGDYFSEPSFQVAFASIPAKDLDTFVKYGMVGAKDVIAKKEATADGFVLVTHGADHGMIAVSVQKAKGETHLTCRASQAKTGGVPNPTATMAWLEKLCASLTIL
jgi:hypothetical protein